MEGQDGGVDAKERVPAQYFHTVVFEVENLMRDHGHRVIRKVVIGGISDRRIDGRLVAGGICGREVRKSGDTD